MATGTGSAWGTGYDQLTDDGAPASGPPQETIGSLLRQRAFIGAQGSAENIHIGAGVSIRPQLAQILTVRIDRFCEDSKTPRIQASGTFMAAFFLSLHLSASAGPGSTSSLRG